ncbi:MAG: Xylose isomerase-like barrel, partial [Chthoniobacteraceae bacterium]|nr:Xylose isomerase-like barrel [Chthoniobacteraceae bacterium]
MNIPLLPRRAFLKTVAGAAATAALGAPFRSEAAAGKIKLGMDNFSVRALGWKASQLLDYADSLKLDTLFISDLEAFDSLEEGYLRDVKAKADALKIELYTGSWSICPSSTRFRKDWGTAEEHLTTGIRVSKTLGSPVFRVVL